MKIFQKIKRLLFPKKTKKAIKKREMEATLKRLFPDE